MLYAWIDNEQIIELFINRKEAEIQSHHTGYGHVEALIPLDEYDAAIKGGKEDHELVKRLTHRNNELRGKVLRLIRKNEELKQTLGEQVHNCINMEYQLDKIKEIIKEDP